MVQVTSISKSYGKEQVLKDVTFCVEKASAACIIGQNGSGKSTLFSIIADTVKPDSGTVTLGSSKGSLGFVPQQNYLFEDLKVKDNIKFWAAAAGLSISSPQVEEYIQLFNVSSFFGKRVSQLSGGMKRRVTLCTSLLHNPDILLLDEPFSGLDMINKEDITIYLNKLRENGKTILYSTHNTDEIHLMANQLFVIYEGQIYEISISSSLENTNDTVINYLKGAF